jgi:hypothetical protein
MAGQGSKAGQEGKGRIDQGQAAGGTGQPGRTRRPGKDR